MWAGRTRSIDLARPASGGRGHELDLWRIERDGAAAPHRGAVGRDPQEVLAAGRVRGVRADRRADRHACAPRGTGGGVRLDRILPVLLPVPGGRRGAGHAACCCRRGSRCGCRTWCSARGASGGRCKACELGLRRAAPRPHPRRHRAMSRPREDPRPLHAARVPRLPRARPGGVHRHLRGRRHLREDRRVPRSPRAGRAGDALLSLPRARSGGAGAARWPCCSPRSWRSASSTSSAS